MKKNSSHCKKIVHKKKPKNAVTALIRLDFVLVPKEGLEPSLPKKRDFESRASTNSATLANSLSVYN